MSDNFLKDKKIMITGACGTVGSELLRQLSSTNNYKGIVCIDNNESDLFMLDQKYISDDRIKFFLGDIRDREKLKRLMEGVDVVFHTAAYKHVILSERSPFEAVQTNILGIQNIILSARECEVEKVIFTSSDKAVNPTNVMGTSKLMGERLISAADSNQKQGRTIFASTRFGNVLGSRGSVIPIFKNQIKNGGPVTLTDENMSRFIMSISQAVQLIIESCKLAIGGEVFITKMPSINIKVLAETMIKILSPRYNNNKIDIKIIGAKPGEKLYEELMNSEETRRSIELEKYFVVIPAYKKREDSEYKYKGMVSSTVAEPYVSETEVKLTHDEIEIFLRENNLLDVKD